MVSSKPFDDRRKPSNIGLIDRTLRIAITADPELPVPPRLYGGIERIIDILVRGLSARGHEITLVAHPESRTAATLVRYSGVNSQSLGDTLRNGLIVTRTVLAGSFDLIHSFARVAYLLPLLPVPIPKLMTYQREVTPRSVRLGHALSRGTLHFCAISDWMVEGTRHLGHWHRVYNGVSMDVYDFVPRVADDAPLIFLGRIEHIKGAHLAIDIARRSGRRLIIAGNIPAGHERYFEGQVRPHVDGDRVQYIGTVDDAQKNRWLGRCAALLMPILWEEPFGIVMAEALACGTPVLGLRRGAVPEVVEDGVTGFVRDHVEGLGDVVARISEINRASCRRRAEGLFSADSMVEGYLDVYRSLLEA